MISKQEWETLVRSIDGRARHAVPQDAICGPCVDQRDSGVEIDCSDGSRLSVDYDGYPGNGPAPLKALKFPNLGIVFYEF